MTLEPDRDQIEIFVDALFRHAPENTYVSLRAFGHDDSVFRITPIRLNGKGLKFLCDAAEDDARRAAQYPTPIVFCPPVAVFSTPNSAAESDLAAGLALSVELDENPHEARRGLEEILGPPTMVVRSGGIWVNGHAEPEDKLHLHWRLAGPATGDDRARLKEARRLAPESRAVMRQTSPPCTRCGGPEAGIARPSRACAKSHTRNQTGKSIWAKRSPS